MTAWALPVLSVIVSSRSAANRPESAVQVNVSPIITSKWVAGDSPDCDVEMRTGSAPRGPGTSIASLLSGWLTTPVGPLGRVSRLLIRSFALWLR